MLDAPLGILFAYFGEISLGLHSHRWGESQSPGREGYENFILNPGIQVYSLAPKNPLRTSRVFINTEHSQGTPSNV